MSNNQASAQILPTVGLAWISLVVLALATGVVLEFNYGAATAYKSVEAIQSVKFWAWFRGVHHWCSAGSIIVGFLWLVQGLFEGAYRKPNQLRWIAAVMGLFIVYLFQLTGHSLPWDQRAVRTTAIETGIAADAPGFGPAQARFLRQGDEVGDQTLGFWHKAHIWFIPAALLALVIIPMGIAKPGAKGSWGLAIILIVTIMAISGVMGAPTLDLTPTASDFAGGPQPPEWYVYPLHGMLRLFQGMSPSVTFVGTMVIPGLALVCLLLLPWLDRSSSGGLGKALAGIGVVAIALLSVMGYNSATAALATESDPPPPSKLSVNPELIDKGRALFGKANCSACHKLAGKGGIVGPPLDNEGGRHPDLQWQMDHLKDPKKMSPGSTMPSQSQYSNEDLTALANYLLSLKGMPASGRH